MLPENKSEHQLLSELLAENQRLLRENNELLRKLKRDSVFGFWFRIIAFLVIIGAPVALYYYVIEPYFESINDSVEVFMIGLQEVPGWQQLYDAIRGEGG